MSIPQSNANAAAAASSESTQDPFINGKMNDYLFIVKGVDVSLDFPACFVISAAASFVIVAKLGWHTQKNLQDIWSGSAQNVYQW